MHDVGASGPGTSTARGPADRTAGPFTRRRAYAALGICTVLLPLSVAVAQTHSGRTRAPVRPGSKGSTVQSRQRVIPLGLGTATAINGRRGRRVRSCRQAPCATASLTGARAVAKGPAANAQQQPVVAPDPVSACHPSHPRRGPSAGCSEPRAASRRHVRDPRRTEPRPGSALPPVSPNPAPGPSASAPGPANPASAAGPGLAPVSAAGPGEPGTAPPSTSPARVQVIATEYSFTLSRPVVPAGEVIIELVNRGQDPHNLQLVSAAEEANATGSFENTAPEHRRDQTLVMRAGSYTLFCSLPGHRAAGMHATLTVQ